jgi:phosphatidylinositol glycan class B
MQDTTILAPLVRIVIALSTRTFFQPDEYFQSLEPAHFLVFGYGYLTWEWLSPQPIRSVIYPALNVPIYWLLKVTGLDSSWLLVCKWLLNLVALTSRCSWPQIAGPRVMHGAFAALTDIWVGKLARQILGDRYASTAVSL